MFFFFFFFFFLFSGHIEFKNVSFAYPTRDKQIVLNNISLAVQPGQTLALVCDVSVKRSLFNSIPLFYSTQHPLFFMFRLGRLDAASRPFYRC